MVLLGKSLGCGLRPDRAFLCTCYIMRIDAMRIICYNVNGWYFVRQVGSHRQFRHAQKPGIVTIPNHKGDLPIGTAKSILRQAGLSSSAAVRR